MNTKNRVGFNQMVEDALNGDIDLILTKSISRFARNTVDTLSTIRKLKEKGVEVYFEKENIYTFDSKGELLLTIMSSLAQEESRSISENVTWGKRQKMARGQVTMTYSKFLGYEKGPDGKPQINEEQAEIVRRIYREFLSGKNASEIARGLQRDDIPGPTGQKGTWQSRTVLSILRNERYKGDALLQKSYIEDFLTKKVRKNNGELRQYYVHDSHPAIIDAETFDLVQDELARRSGMGGGRHSDSPFDRKVICGDCGRTFWRKLWHSRAKKNVYSWSCPCRVNNTTHCKAPNVREDVLEMAFVTAFSQLIGMNQEEYISELEFEIADILSEMDNGEKKSAKEMAEKNARLGRIRRYLAAMRDQVEIVSEFNADAFKALVSHIVVSSDSTDLVVCFKDGTEVSVPRTNSKK